MPWLATMRTDAGDKFTANVGGRRDRPPSHSVIVVDGERRAVPIEGLRWVSKHHKDAQPSLRAIEKRRARERYRRNLPRYAE